MYKTDVTILCACRNALLERWWTNMTTFITREDAIGTPCGAARALAAATCTAMAADDPQSVGWYARVYDFLMEHGHINFGLCAAAPTNGPKDATGRLL